MAAKLAGNVLGLRRTQNGDPLKLECVFLQSLLQQPCADSSTTSSCSSASGVSKRRVATLHPSRNLRIFFPPLSLWVHSRNLGAQRPRTLSGSRMLDTTWRGQAREWLGLLSGRGEMLSQCGERTASTGSSPKISATNVCDTPRSGFLVVANLLRKPNEAGKLQ